MANEKTINSVDSVKELDKTSEIAGMSFLDTMYNEICSVIGGDNANQYFCMMMPGTIVDPKKFEYETGQPKPAHVKANESRLVNKLYDAAFVTTSDNGKTLPMQYKSALSMLSPKLNINLFELKNKLRGILMTPYPYDFGEGLNEDMTLEQVFFRLYDEYVSAKSEWSLKQIMKKEEIEKKYVDKTTQEDKYLEWYGAVAESERVKLQEKMGKVLNVFTPTDMDIINGILNCGVGGEIEQARNTLDMVQELSPNGDYIYPVEMQPANWFELLESSFTTADLLESPAALAQSLRTLQLQRNNILNQIDKLTAVIPSDEKVESAKKSYAEANAAYTEAVEKCVDANLGATADVVSAIVSLCMNDKKVNKNSDGSGVDSNTVERMLDQEKIKDDKGNKKVDEINSLVKKISKGAEKCSKAQSDAVEAGAKCVSAALDWCTANNKKQLEDSLIPLNRNLETINADIDTVNAKLALATSMQSDKNNEEAKADVMPNKSDDMFTEVLINSKMSAISSSKSSESKASESRTRVSFFLGGYSSSSSHQEAIESAMDSSANVNIQIGMNIAKVQIERGWFNPGVFQLTSDMFTFSNTRISPKSDIKFVNKKDDLIQKRFDEMNKSILPAYPVAFVIAKDVSIRFESDSGISASFAEAVEDHASKGGGFLCFSSNKSSSSSSSKSATSASSNAKSITVRFTAPQILGYYMQAVPEDLSTHFLEGGNNDMSIANFMDGFKRVLDDFKLSNTH